MSLLLFKEEVLSRPLLISFQLKVRVRHRFGSHQNCATQHISKVFENKNFEDLPIMENTFFKQGFIQVPTMTLISHG